jgi:hypothetical protein
VDLERLQSEKSILVPNQKRVGSTMLSAFKRVESLRGLFYFMVQNKQMKVGYLYKKFLHFDTSGKFLKIVIHLVPCVVIYGMEPARKHLISNYSLQIFFGSLHVFLYMSNDVS